MTQRLISIDELRDRLGGISRSAIYRHIGAVQNFPQPRKVGGTTRFVEAEVDAFIEGLSEPREASHDRP